MMKQITDKYGEQIFNEALWNVIERDRESNTVDMNDVLIEAKKLSEQKDRKVSL